MKSILFALFAFVTISNGQEIPQAPNLDDALHLKNSKVVSISSTGIRVMYAEGFKTIPIGELPPELIKFYKFDKSIDKKNDISFGVMGETKEQCITRFGNPTKTNSHYVIHNNLLESLIFNKNGYTFTVGFLNGYASSLKIRKENNAVFSDDEIQNLLKSNSNLPWSVGPTYDSTKTWHTPNKSLVALYDPLEIELDERNLVIATREAYEAIFNK